MLPSLASRSLTPARPPSPAGIPGGTAALFSVKALALYIAWFFGLASLHLALPGRTALGSVLPDGSGRLTYKLNGEQLGRGGEGKGREGSGSSGRQ